VAKRPIWLIATVLVLFGLQVPLCALACSQGSDAASIAADQAEPPCHKQSHKQSTHEQSGDSSPAEAPRSEGECGCEIAYEAPLPSADSVSNYGSVAFLLLGTPGQPPHSSVGRARGVPTSTDLPPPDILLLKSTFLI
jgi:hypothetical protein